MAPAATKCAASSRNPTHRMPRLCCNTHRMPCATVDAQAKLAATRMRAHVRTAPTGGRPETDKSTCSHGQAGRDVVSSMKHTRMQTQAITDPHASWAVLKCRAFVAKHRQSRQLTALPAWVANLLAPLFIKVMPSRPLVLKHHMSLQTHMIETRTGNTFGYLYLHASQAKE